MSFFKSILSKQSAILSYYPHPTLIISDSGSIIFANSEAENLIESKDLISQNITDIFKVSIDKILVSDGSKIILNLQIPDSEEKIIEAITKKLPEEPNFILALNDITKSHSIIKELLDEQNSREKLNHQKNNLLSKMENHIKSPLHSVIGFSQAILEGLGGEINEKQEKYLKIIHKNSSELLFLMEKLVELSQLEANLYEYNYKSFDILNTIKTTANEYKQKVEEKRLQLNIDSDLLSKKTCYSDENVIKNILGNLIENAIISCDIGSITIKISNPNLEFVQEKEIKIPPSADDTSFVMIEVIDTGVGSLTNELPEMFDPYIQIDKDSKKNLIKGLMLGISQIFISKMHGKIWIESEIMKESKYSFIIPAEKFLQEQTPENIATQEPILQNEEA